MTAQLQFSLLLYTHTHKQQKQRDVLKTYLCQWFKGSGHHIVFKLQQTFNLFNYNVEADAIDMIKKVFQNNNVKH